MKGKSILSMMIGVAIMWAGCCPSICYAEIASDNAFEQIPWEKAFEDEIAGPSGVVQSMCATEEYIICMENYSEGTQEPDVISAYYRNDTDADGNPVEQYSLAKRVADVDYEHANGMAYNPNTGEIMVALYTNYIPENRGCLYVMDADTLEYQRVIKISDEYNILGIDYMKETNQYMIQTDVDGGYSFKILDADFQVVEDLGEYADTAKGDNFQDLCVSGDYIINFPLTFAMNIGDYVHMYSISRREMVSDIQLDFNFQDVVSDEPESLCELEPGVFMAAVNVIDSAGGRKICFYKATVPYNFNVAVSANNGTVNLASQTVERGGAVPLSFAADEGYELGSVMVNGTEVEAAADGYTLENIQQDQNIEVSFVKPGAAVETTGRASLGESAKGKTGAGFLSGLRTVGMAAAAIGIAFLAYLYHLRVERVRMAKRRRAKRRRQMEWEREPYGIM